MFALVSKALMDPLLACFLACVILRFTSGVTPVDCIEVSMSAEPFRSTYLQRCPQAMWTQCGPKPTTIRATRGKNGAVNHSATNPLGCVHT